MTKFSDGFIKEVKQHWEDNKGKVLGKKVGGIHRKVTSEKKFGIQDVADYFGISKSQAHRIIYIQKVSNEISLVQK